MPNTPLAWQLEHMTANLNNPHSWQEDIESSVTMYNRWFLDFAPEVMREQRIMAINDVRSALVVTRNFRNLVPEVFLSNPEVLSVCRMSTCPPLAADRLIGFSKVSGSLVKGMEKGRDPSRRKAKRNLENDLASLIRVIRRMLDRELFPWVFEDREPSASELEFASIVVADRYCIATANPIIRNAQEKRQLNVLGTWLQENGYRELTESERGDFRKMAAGTYCFRMMVQGVRPDSGEVNIPIDAVVKPKSSGTSELPLLIEAKSAGDFANVNKRRKEEATKLSQLKNAHGEEISLVLLLCGYFNRGYLEFEAAEGIDWVWEHRVGDFASLGL